ncbi:hypothetical protein [Kocuria sp. NPDC057446]|uniref:hypothetical protein n=1 Tax=Kocuria sp. NPDC057446 TaxID=3346137 RepID=UPI003687275B
MGRPAHRRTGSHAVPSPPPHQGAVRAVRAVGVYFAGCAVLNAVHTVRTAPRFLAWLRDSAWSPPHRRLPEALGPAAPAVVLGAACFQAVVGYHLLRGRRVPGALRWAQAWVLGLVPALPWPYWVPNALSAVAFEAVRRRTVRFRAD